MDYTKIYHCIIEHARTYPRSGYTENHHIIPKSLGGSDDPSNLVRLSAREHFVCHRLLSKMYEDEHKAKMVYAVWAMATLENDHQERYKINSRTYQILREGYSELVRERMKGIPRQPHAEETKQKLSESAKKRGFTYKRTAEHNKKMSDALKGKNKGKKRTAEQKKAISDRQKGRLGKPHSKETKQHLREINLGRMRSNESIQKQKDTYHKNKSLGLINTYIRTDELRVAQSERLKGRCPTDSERENYLNAMNVEYTCEHCGKIIKGKGNYNRWHGDHCREKK